MKLKIEKHKENNPQTSYEKLLPILFSFILLINYSEEVVGCCVHRFAIVASNCDNDYETLAMTDSWLKAGKKSKKGEKIA